MPNQSLPYQPSYVISGQQLQNVVVDFADDRTRYGRKKGGRYFEYDLTFRNRQLAEFQAFQTFWQNHYPATAFDWVEPYQNVTHTCYFISPLSYEINFEGAIDYRVRIQSTAA
jgi:phage-related protein